MKKLYHVCITAHKEVLMRNLDDARNFTNLTALAAIRNDVCILVDSLMTNHAHFIVLADDPQAFALSLRISMTKHFNFVHARTGRLFERKVFVSEIDGSRHSLMAINYVLRNGLHHGQSETAFAYPFSTCNFIYMKSRGIPEPKLITNRSEIRAYMPINADFPDTLAIDEHGFASRLSFEELRTVELWYGTPNSFIYNMNRRTNEEWVKEQNLDGNNVEPITLKLLEKGVNLDSEKEMLRNESGCRTSGNDMAICELIDKNLLGRYNTGSIYQLDENVRSQIAVELINDHHVYAAQAARCLAIPVSVLPPGWKRR